METSKRTAEKFIENFDKINDYIIYGKENNIYTYEDDGITLNKEDALKIIETLNLKKYYNKNYSKNGIFYYSDERIEDEIKCIEDQINFLNSTTLKRLKSRLRSFKNLKNKKAK